VARAIGRLRPALHERDELVTDVDERRSRRATAESELEDQPLEGERLFDGAYLERHVVDSDQVPTGSRQTSTVRRAHPKR